jgi:hypothetical protein
VLGTSLGEVLGISLGYSDREVLGISLGDVLGISLGDVLGISLGDVLGISLGYVLDISLGDVLGISLGDVLGISLGNVLGISLGNMLGISLGNSLGISLGNSLGISLGNVLGTSLRFVLGTSLRFVLRISLAYSDGKKVGKPVGRTDASKVSNNNRNSSVKSTGSTSVMAAISFGKETSSKSRTSSFVGPLLSAPSAQRQSNGESPSCCKTRRPPAVTWWNRFTSLGQPRHLPDTNIRMWVNTGKWYVGADEGPCSSLVSADVSCCCATSCLLSEEFSSRCTTFSRI